MSGLTRRAKGGVCWMGFEPRDPVIRASGDPAASLSNSRLIYGCYLQLLSAGQILGRPGVLDLRIETRSALVPPPSSIWKHSLRTIQPEILIQIYCVLIFLD